MNRSNQSDQIRQHPIGSSHGSRAATFSDDSSISDRIFYKYILEEMVLCNQVFRHNLATKLNCLTVTPTKCGQGRRYTKTGVLEIAHTQNSMPPESIDFQGITVKLEPIQKVTYQKSKKEQAVKVFFKGFPPGSTKSDVQSVFGQFGTIQYSYFMIEPSQRTSNARLGYIIYSQREAVDRLLAFNRQLFFGGQQIVYAEYKPNKKTNRKCRKVSDTEAAASFANVSMGDLRSRPLISHSRLAGVQHSSYDEMVESYKTDRVNTISQIINRRPYLKVLDEVRSNTVSVANLRFNLRIARASSSSSSSIPYVSY